MQRELLLALADTLTIWAADMAVEDEERTRGRIEGAACLIRILGGNSLDPVEPIDVEATDEEDPSDEPAENDAIDAEIEVAIDQVIDQIAEPEIVCDPDGFPALDRSGQPVPYLPNDTTTKPPIALLAASDEDDAVAKHRLSIVAWLMKHGAGQHRERKFLTGLPLAGLVAIANRYRRELGEPLFKVQSP